MTVQQEFPTPTPVDEVPNHQAAGQDGQPNEWFNPEANHTAQQDEPRDPYGSLGTNRRRGSGVRQLTRKDLDQLHGLYSGLGFALMPFHERGATALMENGKRAVDAWEELAKQNDAVRRALLAIIEGGAWGAVITAHIPIMYAFVPEHVMERMPLLFGRQPGDETEESEE